MATSILLPVALANLIYYSVSVSVSVSVSLSLALSPLHTHTLPQQLQSGRNYSSKQPDFPSFRKFLAGQGEGPGWGRAPYIPHPLCVLAALPVPASSHPHTQPRGASAFLPLLSSPLNPRGKLLGDKEGWAGPAP